MDVVPTFKTTNGRLLLLLSRGEVGMLRIQDAERLQVSTGLICAQAAYMHREHAWHAYLHGILTCTHLPTPPHQHAQSA